MSNQSKRVEFSPAQLEYLDQSFPEIIGTSSTLPEERAWRSAQRSVLYHLKSRLAKGVE